jgi:hypothetical protein
MSLEDYMIALLATAGVLYCTGRMLIASYFVARRQHFNHTMRDITRGEEQS